MNYEFTPGLQLQVGQYPVSFQWRLSPRRHQFAEGGVASRAFSFPRIRDIGVLLHGENPRRSASYALGVYNGAGPNVELGASNGHMVSAGVHVAVHG
ncbi:MAG: hypothetical protein HY704_05090, partial [Gemmatimonadetes bacterium]|nr:hypothetical protein [Gemmatimonadota bacterium]